MASKAGWDAKGSLLSLGLSSALGVSLAAAGQAAMVGGARTVPLEQAVQRSRLAAEAVIQRRGKETCLRGKLTNALLGLSASCEAGGQRSPLCVLADQAVVQTGWSMAFMDATAQRVLELIRSEQTH